MHSMKRERATVVCSIVLLGMLSLVVGVQKVGAAGTVYIRPDGSVDPSAAPIQRNLDVYTLTGNITSDETGIIVQASNIVVDGNGYTVQGIGANVLNGFYLSNVNNVTIKNTSVKNFTSGISLSQSSYNTITGNNIANNSRGVGVSIQFASSNNNVTDNCLTGNWEGIHLTSSDHNVMLRNSISGSMEGIHLVSSNYNSIASNNVSKNNAGGVYLRLSSNHNGISENNITENGVGIHFSNSSDNSVYHNNLVNNTLQVYNEESINAWDDGYPSGGNYWSDYKGNDTYRGPGQNQPGSDGIGDTPYTIDAQNQDHYPIIPEFQAFLIIPMLMIATLSALKLHRRRSS